MTVITGPSGSGKSSLAFETIYAEGQRRYVETFSPYMRQFLDRMDKPRVDEIRGIPPAIAIEQSNPVKSSRSTVGTMTEINDYLKLLWPRVARAFCPNCDREIRPETAKSIGDQIVAQFSHPCHPERSAAKSKDLKLPSDKESKFEILRRLRMTRRGIQQSSSPSGSRSRRKPRPKRSSISFNSRATSASGSRTRSCASTTLRKNYVSAPGSRSSRIASKSGPKTAPA